MSTPIKKCPNCKIGSLLSFRDHLKCNNCQQAFDLPQSDTTPQLPVEKEREFTFHDYNEKKEIVNTRHVKESELSENDCLLMSMGFYQQFLLLPVKTQDFFIRKVINEAMAAQDEAIAEKTPPSKIITDLN